MTRYREAVVTSPRNVVLLEREVPPLLRGQVLVETICSGISHATEMSAWQGRAASQKLTWDDSRKIYAGERGEFVPTRPGYETVGRVAALAPGISGLDIDDRVWLDRPHAELHVVSQEAALSGRLPDGLPDDRATFAASTRIALAAVHDGNVRLGSEIAVIGLGVIGLLTVRAAVLSGARLVLASDPQQQRRGAAARLGAVIPASPGFPGFPEWVKDNSLGPGVDVAIETSGTYSGLEDAIRCCRVGGTVVAVSSYRDQSRNISLGAEFHRNRLSLISSMSHRNNPSRDHPAWDSARLQRTALDLLANGEMTPESLITDRIPFERIASAYELIENGRPPAIRIVITYPRQPS